MIVLGTIVCVVAVTYLFFRAFGPRGKYLFLSRKQKDEWDQGLAGSLGTWVTITNIFGTITSFATVIFLMGSVKLFGFFSLSTGITIMIGAAVTNFFTRRLLSDAHIAERLKTSDQTVGVIAMLLWSDSAAGRTLSRVTKWVSLVAIASIVWLEFTIFSDFTSSALGIGSNAFAYRSLTVFATAFVVVFFVLYYGIRGFTFADFLHGPLISVAAVVLFIGVAIAYSGPNAPWNDMSSFVAPVLSYWQGAVFAAHVLVLNCLQVLCTEPHWMRVWLLGDRETTKQVPAMASTAVFWLLMLAIGLTAAAASGKIGEEAIAALLGELATRSIVFVSVFWVAVTAALFSTADTQAYCFLLVWKFDPRSGSLTNIASQSFRPALLAVGAAALCSVAYFIVRSSALPVEKIIFVVIPSVVTLAPPIILKALGRIPLPFVLWISLIGYIAVATYGFIRPDTEFYATLSAVFVPLFVTVVLFWFCPRANEFS
jgi:hypothetical protein